MFELKAQFKDSGLIFGYFILLWNKFHMEESFSPENTLSFKTESHIHLWE